MKCIIHSSLAPRIITVLILSVFLLFSISTPGSALTPAQQKIFRYGIYYYDEEVNTACANAVGGGSSGTGDVSTTASQEANAKIVIGIAKTDNLGKEGAFIGLMAALTESKLAIYANSSVPVSLSFPHEIVGSDHDSLGIFQQRITQDWSTISNNPSDGAAVKQLMDPAYNAEAFFGSPAGSNAPGPLSKGLQNISNWQSLDPWVAAQKVQHSRFSDGANYKAYADKASALLAKLWDASPPVPLPVPLTGGSSSTSSVSNSSCAAICNTTTTDTNVSNVRQQVVCVAQAEYQQWQSGKLKPGTDFHKYSLGRDENWCADFASWVYNQAGYPIDSGAKDGNVPAVATIETTGKLDKLFHYHAATGYTPKPGDLAIHYKDGSPSHVNIVTAVSGNTITLIGGNQSTYDFTTSNVSQYNLTSSTDDGVTGYVSPE